jgi:hypothetical protein
MPPDAPRYRPAPLPALEPGADPALALDGRLGNA